MTIKRVVARLQETAAKNSRFPKLSDAQIEELQQFAAGLKKLGLPVSFDEFYAPPINPLWVYSYPDKGPNVEIKVQFDPKSIKAGQKYSIYYVPTYKSIYVGNDLDALARSVTAFLKKLADNPPSTFSVLKPGLYFTPKGTVISLTSGYEQNQVRPQDEKKAKAFLGGKPGYILQTSDSDVCYLFSKNPTRLGPTKMVDIADFFSSGGMVDCPGAGVMVFGLLME